MVKEVSNRVVIILLVIAVIVSVIGTYVVYENAKEDNNDYVLVNPTKPSPSTGFVTLQVIDNKGEINEEEK